MPSFRMWWRRLFGLNHPKPPRQPSSAPSPQIAAGAGYSDVTIATAVLLVRSHDAIRRITEDVTIRGTTLHRDTTMDFALDRRLHSGERLVVPLGAGCRGRLWDVQEASCDGRAVAILVHAENEVIARAVIADAWRRGLGDEDALGPDMFAAVLNVPKAPSREAAAIVRLFATAVGKWEPDDAVRTAKANEVCRIVEFFARNYIVFGEVPCDVGERFVVRLRVSAPYKVRRRGPLRRWRASGGLRPVTLTIPLYGAPFRAMSYHLRVKAPDGYHVHLRQLMVGDEQAGSWKIEPEDPVDLDGSERPKNPVVEPSRILWSPTGGDYAHLYFPNSGGQARSREAYVAKVKFAEDLPGSIVGAFTPAAMIAALVLGALIWYDRVFPFAINDPEQTAFDQANSSFAVLLLAIPGITAVWFRPRRVDELVRIPLTSLIAPFVTGSLSFAITVLYLGFRLSPCRRVGEQVAACNEDRRHVIWVIVTVSVVAWALFLFERVVAKQSSEERCRLSWCARTWARLTRRRPWDKALPWRPPRWLQKWWTGEDPDDTVDDPADVANLDALYERLRPTSKRGDIYLTRADSFDFPFTTGTPRKAERERVRAHMESLLKSGRLGPLDGDD